LTAPGSARYAETEVNFIREASRMTRSIRALTLLTAATSLLAVFIGNAPALAQDATPTVVAPDGSAAPGWRFNVANEWEIHRRAASPNYRPKYQSLFVDPGYARYCPLQPHWNGVYSAGGRPRW